MEGVILRPGDVFAVEGSMGVLSKIIVAIESFWAKDNDAKYGHAGTIIDQYGTTIEALLTIKEGNLSAYVGKNIIIARPIAKQFSGELISAKEIDDAIADVRREEGRVYPVWRLFLYLVPPLASRFSTGIWKVCSELTAYIEHKIGARTDPWPGVNPDTIADEWIRWKNFEVIYEGVWKIK